MNRRFLFNSIAAGFVVLLLVLFGRSMQSYEPELGDVPAAETAPPGAVTGTDAVEGGEGAATSAPAEASNGLAEAAGLVRHAEIGFRTPERLAEHFEKHGAEFGSISADGYLLLAQALRDRDAGGDVLERVREGGVVTRYDRASGAFLAFDRDFTIRTFFRPVDGEAYFLRQGLRD